MRYILYINNAFKFTTPEVAYTRAKLQRYPSRLHGSQNASEQQMRQEKKIYVKAIICQGDDFSDPGTILENTHRGDFAIYKAVLENLHKHLFVFRMHLHLHRI